MHDRSRTRIREDAHHAQGNEGAHSSTIIVTWNAHWN